MHLWLKTSAQSSQNHWSTEKILKITKNSQKNITITSLQANFGFLADIKPKITYQKQRTERALDTVKGWFHYCLSVLHCRRRDQGNPNEYDLPEISPRSKLVAPVQNASRPLRDWHSGCIIIPNSKGSTRVDLPLIHQQPLKNYHFISK